MEQQKVDMYLLSNQKYFPVEKIEFLRQRLLTIEDDKFGLTASVDLKDPTVYLLLSIFLGAYGVDRFLIGDIGMGVLKLLTGGLCGILWIIDICTIMGKVKEKNFNEMLRVLSMC